MEHRPSHHTAGTAVVPDGSPLKRARLSGGAAVPSISLDAVATVTDYAASSMLSPASSAELDGLSRAFTAACCCSQAMSPTAGAASSAASSCCGHLDLAKIQASLQAADRRHLLPAAAATSTLPPSTMLETMRLASAPTPCSCIPLPLKINAAATATSSLKRRHHISPPLTPVSLSTQQLHALSVSGSAAPAVPTATSRPIVKVKKSAQHASASPQLRPRDALGFTTTPSPCSLTVEFDEDTASPLSDDDTSPRPRTLMHITSSATSAASTRSLSPVVCTKTQAQSHFHAGLDDELSDEMVDADHSLMFAEIARIEEEEREDELNFLMTNNLIRTNSQHYQSMPYIL